MCCCRAMWQLHRKGCDSIWWLSSFEGSQGQPLWTWLFGCATVVCPSCLCSHAVGRVSANRCRPRQQNRCSCLCQVASFVTAEKALLSDLGCFPCVSVLLHHFQCHCFFTGPATVRPLLLTGWSTWFDRSYMRDTLSLIMVLSALHLQAKQ